MSEADSVIAQIRKMPPAEKEKVRDFVFSDGEQELREKVKEGLAALDRGDVVDGKEAFERLRKRAQEFAAGT